MGDFHSSSKTNLAIDFMDTRKRGFVQANQMFIFKCARSSVNDIPVINSGFVITKKATVVDDKSVEMTLQAPTTGHPEYKTKFVVKKVGAPVTIGLLTTAAGSTGGVALEKTHLLP
jgi:hypothetical protein